MRRRERWALTFGISAAVVVGGALAAITHVLWLVLLGILIGAMLGILVYFVF